MVNNQQRRGLSSGFQEKAVAEIAYEVVYVTGVVGDPLLLLECGDLRVIDHIHDVDPIAVQR